tara:strand:+ start:4172 stop:4732 length:561 start_codon:yes stop_codon:yes gene_type:complete
MKNKVFCIGMFKTGTTSLGMALEKLEYASTYDYWPLEGIDDWLEDESLNEKFYEIVKLKAYYYDAFADSPWLFFYKQLDQWFPNSKFILTLRSKPENVADSDIKMWKREGAEDINIPPSEKFINRYNEHNKRVREYFKDRPDDLLEICFEKGDAKWDDICEFLGDPIPNCAFPHTNISPDKLEKIK